MRKVATILFIALLAITHFVSGVAASSLDTYGDKSIQLSTKSDCATALDKSSETVTTSYCDKQSIRHHSTGSHCIADCGAIVSLIDANLLHLKQRLDFVASPTISSKKFYFLFRPPIV